MNWIQRQEELLNLSKKLSGAIADELRLKEYKKIKEAELMKRAEADEGDRKGITVAAKQLVYAHSHEEYKKNIDGLVVATEIRNCLQYEMEIMKIGFEVWRTNQATAREERKIERNLT